MKSNFKVNNEPASITEINHLLNSVGPLPGSYLLFLQETNGAEFGITDSGGDCLLLWSVQEIIEGNNDYCIQEHLPQALAIGSDGGGDAILLDRSINPSRPSEWPVVRVAFASLDVEEFIVQAKNFTSWAENKFKLLA